MNKLYFLILDVETANTTEDALVYNIGLSVRDKQDNVYEEHSLLVKDIYQEESELMTSAYYAAKIPEYDKGLKNGDYKMLTFYDLRMLVLDILRRYPKAIVCAYNAHFDTTALNTTHRWLTKSKYRWFLPYGTEVWDIWNMACQVICTQKRYKKFCEKNNLFSAKGNMLTNAEAVYSYISKNPLFQEEHTGLADVQIEAKILNHCFRQHKKMNRKINRSCWRIPQVKKA